MSFRPDPQIADALPRLSAGPLECEVWKHTFAGQPADAANTRGARWNPRDVPAIYVALERDTALAEGSYLASVQPRPIQSGRSLHRLQLVGLVNVLDLRDPEVLAALGVTAEELVATNFEACQRVGGTAEWLGYDGLLVPSARANGVNLVIFQRKAEEAFLLESIDVEPVDGVAASKI